MTSSDAGWAVGNDASCVNATCGSVILHWNGTYWQKQEVIEDYWLYDIEMTEPNDGWIVGYEGFWLVYPGSYTGIILRWDGTSWSLHTSFEDSTLRSVAMAHSNDGWAVGSTLLRWDGETWEEPAIPIDVGTLYSVDMVSASDGWAVGSEGCTIHWDGAAWQWVTNPVSGPQTRLLDVEMTSYAYGWAVGTYVILHYWVPQAWFYIPFIGWD
jgi:hypothetical protein